MSNKAKSRAALPTEQQNPRSADVDTRSIPEILETINSEDQTVALKVAETITDITKAVEMTTAAIRNSHKIYYIGAGTSGRLGVLDAAEMPPTFSTPANWFNGIIAGGDEALRTAVEGVEDKPENAVKDLQEHGVEKGDVIIGISTSGAAAYVQRAIVYGKELVCGTCYILCTPVPFYEADADVVIKVETGPEIITGSTRMKAGTATKLVLNMISTATMIQLGKVYGNLMVDLMAVNDKLLDRGTRIIQQLTGLRYHASKEALVNANKSVKTAVVMVKMECSLNEAQAKLKAVDGVLAKLLH